MMTPAQYCFYSRLRCRAEPGHLWSPWIWNIFQVWTLLPVTQIGFLDVAPDRSCICKFKLKCLQIAPFQVCPPKKIHVAGGTPPSHTHPPTRRFAPRTCASHMFLTYLKFYTNGRTSLKHLATPLSPHNPTTQSSAIFITNSVHHNVSDPNNKHLDSDKSRNHI